MDFDLLKEQILNLMDSKDFRPMTIQDMAFSLDLPERGHDIFRQALDDICNEGKALLTKKGKVITPAMANLVFGIFERHPKGFGFVLDVFIPPGDADFALHGDKVLCRIREKNDPNPIGEIVKIVSRSRKSIVGTYVENGKRAHVIPDDKRFPKILINDLQKSRPKRGQKVVADLSQSLDTKEHSGRIAKVLGNIDDIGMDVLSIVIGHEIPYEFPKNVLKTADRLHDTVLDTDLPGRRDFRALPTVTIDGEDTKDIDDAVSLEMLDGGRFRLYVHIADVSHYVPYGGHLWKEAAKRGTSVYLADRVIPMLPKKLSNGICSLNPHVDRLALSCIMDIDENGQVISHEICQSVIHSDDAVTYEELPDLEIFHNMDCLAKLLKRRRMRQGAIEFDFPEAKIVVDAKGRPIDIQRRERNAATSIIEEFMVAANEVVATEYHWLQSPFIYRVHEEPDQAKIEALMIFIRHFGYSLKGSGMRAKSLQGLLTRVENTPEAMLISKQVLRSMKQARYFPVALGHFGLAKEFYSHFTSPIRRFPDLVIHSIIKANLNGQADISDIAANLAQICLSSSETERRADICQQDVENLKKVEFMRNKVGRAFDGMITHVTPRGFFVELPNTVEGFVSTDTPMEMYNIGKAVKVVLAKADMEMRRLDFELVP